VALNVIFPPMLKFVPFHVNAEEPAIVLVPLPTATWVFAIVPAYVPLYPDHPLIPEYPLKPDVPVPPVLPLVPDHPEIPE
jgi:hypothetical protein